MMSLGNNKDRDSMDLDSPDRPFDNIINFRDVGKSINTLMGKHTEHRMATQKRRLEQNIETDQAALLLDADEHLANLPGVRRMLISLTGKAWERSLLWRLDWVNFFKVLGLATAGYRIDAVKILAQQVMAPRGLIGLGQDTIDSSTFEMKEVFDILAHHPSNNEHEQHEHDDDDDDDDGSTSVYPLLIHCTQGKDRTGLIILLLLLLTHAVSDSAISADYVRSEPELVVEAEERLKEIRAMGIPEEYIKCPDGFTGAIRRYLEERYGGVEGYLASIGIDGEMQERIRGVLVL